MQLKWNDAAQFLPWQKTTCLSRGGGAEFGGSKTIWGDAAQILKLSTHFTLAIFFFCFASLMLVLGHLLPLPLLLLIQHSSLFCCENVQQHNIPKKK